MTDAKTKGSQTLADYPGELVQLACNRCDRRGQYRRTTLMTLFGSTASLPDVLAGLARCPKAGDPSAPCGAYFIDFPNSDR
jgi:hypothetical protein